MVQLITPELKDAVLDYIIENCPFGDPAEISRTVVIHGLNDKVLFALLKQFEQIGLVARYVFTSDNHIFYLQIKAHDFKQRGGFYGQEMLFQKSVEDLLFEIEKVKPSLTEQAEKITTIISNITGFLALISS